MVSRFYMAGIALACAVPGAAQAEGWTVTDFSSVANRAICMSYAESTINTYRQRFGQTGFTGRSDWTIGGYDLFGDMIDALFICADESGLVAPFLVVYNADDTSDLREQTANRLEDIWDEIVANGGAVGTGLVPTNPTPPLGATK